MASLIQRHGGIPYPAPVLQENYLEDDPQVNQLADDICDGNVQVVVLLTGVIPPEPYSSLELLSAIHDIDLAGREMAVQTYVRPMGF